jgi:O-antigen/teichoic acid export membrane protein
MDLFARFKKDYFNYLISFILPALVTGISIPVFKRILGSEGYGNFSIWFNAVLIVVAILTGWITNSVLRFFAASEDRAIFVHKALRVSLYSQIVFFIPATAIVWYLKGSLLLAIFFSISLLCISLQFIIGAICQAGFLSRKIMFVETIRVGTYVSIALFFLLFSRINYLHGLFFATIFSYVLSAIYLYRQASKVSLITNSNVQENKFDITLTKQFFIYGAPFSFWYMFALLLAYIDKAFMLKNIGAEVQGNYQAIFDILSRAITILIYPIVTSLFPILADAYEKGKIKAIKELLKKIILYELMGFILASILYWLFGADLLFLILKTPNTLNYKLMGFIIIAGTFIWQMAIVVHKNFELKLKSFTLLKMVTVAFLAQLLLYLFCGNTTNQLLYPLGYLTSSVAYLIMVSYSEFKVFLKPLSTKFTMAKKND